MICSHGVYSIKLCLLAKSEETELYTRCITWLQKTTKSIIYLLHYNRFVQDWFPVGSAGYSRSVALDISLKIKSSLHSAIMVYRSQKIIVEMSIHKNGLMVWIIVNIYFSPPPTTLTGEQCGVVREFFKATWSRYIENTLFIVNKAFIYSDNDLSPISVPNHYLNQSCRTVNWTARYTLQICLNQTTNIFYTRKCLLKIKNIIYSYE